MALFGVGTMRNLPISHKLEEGGKLDIPHQHESAGQLLAAGWLEIASTSLHAFYYR